MGIKIKIFIPLFLVFIFSIFAESGKTNVAVGDLVASGISKSEAITISNSLRSDLIKTEIFNVMERKQMNEILEEQKFQNSDLCDNQSCIVEMGRLLTVKYMVGGNLGKVGKLFTIDLKLIDVESGNIITSTREDCDCPLEEFYKTIIPKIVDSFTKAVYRLKCGKVEINTNPKGASVYLEGKDIGVTPIKNYYCLPESYKIEINMNRYKSITEVIEVEKGKSINKLYTLEHTQEWKDSVALAQKMRQDSIQHYKDSSALAQKRKKKTIRWIRRIFFGGCTAGFMGAGLYMNNEIKKSVERQQDIKDEYESKQSNVNYDYYKNEMDSEDEKTKESAAYRNIFYSLGGACGIGFVISIPF